MVGAADLAALPKEHASPVSIKGKLVKASWDSVSFDPYCRDGSGVEHVRRGNQDAQRRVGGEEDTVIAVKEAIGGGGHVGIKFNVPQISILI